MKWNLKIGLVCLCVCVCLSVSQSVRPLPLIAQKPLIALIWFLVGWSGMSLGWCPSFRNFEKKFFDRLRGVFVPRGETKHYWPNLRNHSSISLDFLKDALECWKDYAWLSRFEKNIFLGVGLGGFWWTPGESLKPFTSVSWFFVCWLEMVYIL